MTSLIQQHARRDESILVFPHLPLLYGRGGRPLATFPSIAHWPDVCPDAVAESEAERLQNRPPALIVWFDFPEFAWTQIEQEFRTHRTIGQRKLQASMRQLVARDYRIIGEFPVRGFVDAEGKPMLFILVWARLR